LTITTTLDLKAQRSAQKAVNERIPPKDESGKAAAITMIRPGTGEIVAMAQNRTWGRSGAGKTAVNYNAPLANNGTVGFQAGSTFKIYTVAAALKQGFDPFEMIGSPQKATFKDFVECGTDKKMAPYEVQNSTGSGGFNMLSATAFSVNTYFVGLEEQIGLCGPPEIAQAAGLTQGNGEDFPKYPCFTLGCFDVTTLDMAESLATFAAHGIHCESIAISRIVDRKNQDIPVPTPDCERTIDLQVADSTSAILAGVIDGPLGGRTGRAMDIGRDAAGKTGTTDSSAAVWFVGYTPDLAAAVWVGDPRGGQSHPMKNITINGKYYSQVFGSTMPGPIWREAMLGALDGTPKTRWNLSTLHGLNPGGYGNDVKVSKAKCDMLNGEKKEECELAEAEKKAAEEAAAQATATPTPVPSPSST
jgi:membrane peptidoglycan carboxypeptidase